MNIFHCACGNTVYFENTRCLACDRELGFLPERMEHAALEPESGKDYRAITPKGEVGRYRKCANFAEEDICNWMVPADSKERFCEACRLNQVIPNLAKPGNREKWLNVEREKRRLIYELKHLGLPFHSKREDAASGLAFAFMEDEKTETEFADAAGDSGRVFTGHANGLITINILEADDAAREAIRQRMNEASRTLLGHFRHEIGHYYWDRLIRDGQRQAEFRRYFGDERLDYQAALKRYYNQGPPPDWNQRFISAYASAHPWEDWAECWGHYLQIRDALETALALEFIDARPTSFDHLIRLWTRLSTAINLMNRSMGMRDAYPFVLTDPVIEKIRFIHELIYEVGQPPRGGMGPEAGPTN